MTDYQREIAVLARELRADDPTLTEAEAREQAEDQMLALYTYALRWNNAALAQRSQATQTA